MATEERRQQAREIIEEALADAREATPALQRLTSLEFVGRTLAAVDPERAFALIEEARQEFWRDLGLGQPSESNDPRAEARRIMCSLTAQEGGGLFPKQVREILQTPDPGRALARARKAAERQLDHMDFALWATTAARVFPGRAVEFYRRARHADWCMANTVRIFARTDPGRALDLARHIDRRWNRVVALCEVADALVARDPAAATEVVHEALAEARADDREDYRAWLLRHVVRTLRLVDREAALGVARELPVASERARALAGIAGALVRHEPARAPEVLEEALRAAREAPDERARWLESELVEAWAEVDIPRALTMARQITSPNARVAALAVLLPPLVEEDPRVACDAGEELIADGRKQVSRGPARHGPRKVPRRGARPC